MGTRICLSECGTCYIDDSEPTIDMAWPDTDYSTGHPQRNWGTLTIKGSKKDAVKAINSALERKEITESEAKYIANSINLGDKFIPEHIFNLVKT